ncbi:MAG: hypothetical protein AAFX78_14715 [Cyanobacteria bacterium J06638_20]
MNIDAWAEKVRLLYPTGCAIFIGKWYRVHSFEDERDRLEKSLRACGFVLDILRKDERFAYRLRSDHFRIQSEYFSNYEGALYDAIEMALRVMEQRTRKMGSRQKGKNFFSGNRKREKVVELSWYQQVKGKQ